MCSDGLYRGAQRMNRLPKGFESLEPFVEHWDVPTSHERWNRRASTPYPDIERFYAAMFARAEEATAYVEQFSLDAMPEDAARLFRLVLALNHASIAVELHQASRVPHSPFPHSLRLVSGMQPHG
jgi:hypothetical protein